MEASGAAICPSCLFPTTTMQLQPARWDKGKLPASDDDDDDSSRPCSPSPSPEWSDGTNASARSLPPRMRLKKKKPPFEFRVIKQASATPSHSSSTASTDKELVPIPSPPWAKSKPLPPPSTGLKRRYSSDDEGDRRAVQGLKEDLEREWEREKERERQRERKRQRERERQRERASRTLPPLPPFRPGGQRFLSYPGHNPTIFGPPPPAARPPPAPPRRYSEYRPPPYPYPPYRSRPSQPHLPYPQPYREQNNQTVYQQAAAARHAAYSNPGTVDSTTLTTHPVPYSIGVKAASSTAGMAGDAGRLVGEYEQHPLRQQTSYLPISAVGGAQFVLKPPRIPKTKASKLKFMMSAPDEHMTDVATSDEEDRLATPATDIEDKEAGGSTLSFVEFRPPPPPTVKNVPSNPRPAPPSANGDGPAPMSAFTSTFPAQPPHLRQPRARNEYRVRYNAPMLPPQQQTLPLPVPDIYGSPPPESLSVQVHVSSTSSSCSQSASAVARTRRGPKPRRNDFDAVLDPSQTAAQGGQIRMRVLPQATYTPPVQPALAIMHEQPHVVKRKGKRMDGLVPEYGFVPREYVYRVRE